MSGAVQARRSGRERGSALLIVFVFAAMVAIFLYKEMPAAAFEAQRQKEQLLIDRGDEYKRAVKLYVRKFGRFPSSIEQLEDTNRMRFLRQRYKDPLTGSDEWRLIHAGPGGVILDSKIASNNNKANGTGTTGANGAMGATGANTTSTTTGSQWFGYSSTGTSATDTANGNPQVATRAPVPQRAPAVPVNGNASAGNAAGPDPTSPLLAAGQAADLTNNAPGAVDPNQAAQGSANQAAIAAATAGLSQEAALASGSTVPVAAGDTKQTMQALLGNSNPSTPSPTNNASSAQTASGATATGSTSAAQSTSTSTTTSNSSKVMGGGIAGVASKGKGATIKRINDQSDYSLWEFYYDMAAELAGNGVAGSQIGNGNAAGTNGSGTANGNTALGTTGSANSSTTSTNGTATTNPNGTFGVPNTPMNPQTIPQQN